MNSDVLRIAEKQADLCKTFGNARRLLILWILSKDEFSVNEIARQVGSSLQNVSQHLSVLKKSGIVTTRRDGQTIYYKIAEEEWLRQYPVLLQIPDSFEKINLDS